MDMHHPGHAHPPEGQTDEPPAFHGMVVLGSDTVFLSHLPMFMGAHKYQVILHVSFGAEEGTYRQDRKAHPNTRLYTFAPTNFVLPNVFLPPGDKNRVSQFSGSLIRNHFEQPPAHPEKAAEIASDVPVEVLEVVHHHSLDEQGRRPEKMGYLLFGKGDERFLAHLITRRPDFDQLVTVKVEGTKLSDDQLLGGIEVTVDRPDDPKKRLAEGDRVKATAVVGGKPTTLDIAAGKELYFDTADLS